MSNKIKRMIGLLHNYTIYKQNRREKRRRRRKGKMKVKEIMSFPAIAEDVEVPVAKIIKHMELSRIGSVVITKAGKPAGMAVDQDIAAKVILKDINLDEMKAKEIMSSPVITVEADAPVEDASGIMARKGIRRLPVIEHGELVGVISIRNILTGKPEHVRKYLF